MEGKWISWLKWLIIMAVTLVGSFLITVVIIFSSFEDVEANAKEVCEYFKAGDTFDEVKEISIKRGLKPNIDEKRVSVSFFFDGGFLDIAGCELYFEDKKLVKKEVWVD